MVSQPIDLKQDRWQKKTAGGGPVPQKNIQTMIRIKRSKQINILVLVI